MNRFENYYLCGRDVLESTLFHQIPDNNKTPTIANDNLVWVDWVLL